MFKKKTLMFLINISFIVGFFSNLSYDVFSS